MSFLINNKIRFSDSPNIDAFNRLRTSEPFTLFQSTFTNVTGDTFFETILTSGGTVTYSSDTSDYTFNVFSNGDSAIREQHGYNYYFPGKSQLVFLTGVFGLGVSNVIKRIGYYNDYDGLFFEYSGSSFGVVLRTSTSGIPIDTFIPQNEWNLDTLNTGNTLNPSGFHLNPSNTNIFVINFQWLGVGRVIFALDLDGQIIPVHQILNANNKSVVYMKQPNLPIRYEVLSTGGSDDTFKQICSSVISEGGSEQDYNLTPDAYTTVSNKLTTRTFNSRQSLISTRLNTIFDGRTNRTLSYPIKMEIMTISTNVNAYWELVLQKGFLGEDNLGGSPTWVSVENSPIQYSIDGTTVTGGTILDSGFIFSTTVPGNRTISVPITRKINLSLDYSGTTSDWLHLVVTPSNISSWTGTLTFKNLY